MNDAALSLSEKELYELGCQAGHFLRMLHDLPICQSKRNWQDFYQAKMDAKLANYQVAVHPYRQGDLMLEVVSANRHLIRERPICYHHGDFHTGNFLLGSDKQLKILDFGSHDIGDPWEEFNRLIFTAHLSSEFACGQIDTYFEGRVPERFWSLLLLYLTVNSLGALSWAERVDPTQIPFVTSQAEILSDWYDSFRLSIPKWYPETKDKIRKMTDF